jgi:integrase
MTKENYKNEQKKREFIEYLKGAEGFSQSSINSFAGAIDQWQIFTKYEDFIKFNKTKALSFRDWLKTRKSKTEKGTISLVTQYNYLRRVKRFFMWLNEQIDFRNKLIKSDIEFLRLSKADARIARQGTTKKVPGLEDVKKVIRNIEIKNEIDMRDRAIICFAIITGMRISAITTLRMKNFDLENKQIDQNPADGVKTKNSKRILTTFFPIGWNIPEKYFLEWYKYLQSKGFQSEDPIFPATANHFSNKKFAYSKKDFSNSFWSGTSGARKIFEKRCKKAGLFYFNPHSFRHLVVKILSKTRLTEEEKKAVSLNLGHTQVGTTFGSYGYGNMTDDEAVEIVKKINCNKGKKFLSGEELTLLKKISDKISI